MCVGEERHTKVKAGEGKVEVREKLIAANKDKIECYSGWALYVCIKLMSVSVSEDKSLKLLVIFFNQKDLKRRIHSQKKNHLSLKLKSQFNLGV